MKKILKKYSFVLIILLLVLLYHHPIIGGILESKLAVSFEPDTQYILSVIEWNQYSLLNEPGAIYHLNYFYPSGYVTFYGHPLFGETLVFIILNNLAGISLVNTFNLYLLLSFWIGGVGVFLFAREVLKSDLGGITAAGIYIFFPHLIEIANLLNVFSFFWIGYILYYIVRFYREMKWKYAFYSGVFIFCQGLFSIYHGFFLIAILLPLLFLLLLIFRYLDFKSVLKFTISLLPFLILLVLIFHPFISTIQDSDLKRHFSYDSLVDSSRLFSAGSFFYKLVPALKEIKFKLFPGFMSIAFAIIALTGINRKKIIWFSFMLSQFFLIYVLNLQGFVLITNLIMILIIIEMIFYLYYYRDIIQPDIKLFFLLFIIYFLVFFKFSTVLGGYEFSVYGILLKAFPPLSNFRFLFRGILVLLPIFSVIVSAGLMKIIRRKEKYGSVIVILFLLFVGLENFAGYNPIRFDEKQPKKYRTIKKNSNKIILELPIFKPGFGQVRNSRYTINTRHHYNYYVNGRTAYRHFGSNIQIFDRVMKNRQFPDREVLKYLIENYSVDYVIINHHRRFPLSISKIRERTSELSDICKIIDIGDTYVVLELSETGPQKKFIRKYSPFHLKNRKLKLSMSGNYTGRVSVSVEGKTEGNSIIVNNSSNIILNFPDLSPAISGEKILISFDKEVKVLKIDLVEK